MLEFMVDSGSDTLIVLRAPHQPLTLLSTGVGLCGGDDMYGKGKE